MGREEGRGFRMGNTCIPVADSFRYWQNQYNIVKFKNKIKFKKKIGLIKKFIQIFHVTGKLEWTFWPTEYYTVLNSS